MLRAVLDTNIYIAGFVSPTGPNARLWTAATEGQYLLLVSPAIIIEIAAVLRKYFGWPEVPIQKQIRHIAKVADVVRTVTTLNLISLDPHDNRVLECAVDGGADVIVSNDHHLLNLKTCNHIPIVAGPDFRRTLGIS
jgi:putative PIN family toxin of toxin-antitoxin system